MSALSPPGEDTLAPLVRAALAEDLGEAGDITTNAVVPEGARARAKLVARQEGRICGLACARLAFQLLDRGIVFEARARDGEDAPRGAALALVEGRARPMLSAERVALNFLGRLSGIATATRALVRAAAGTKAQIVCTRKTTPGLRLLEKYAVRCGGGVNHRFGLYDAILIKDNHIRAAGGVAAALERAQAARAKAGFIEIEVETLTQLREALAAGAQSILLDNMDVPTLREAVRLAAGRAMLEASGGVTLESARAIAETGVDRISSGAITHSAPSLDVALDFD